MQIRIVGEHPLAKNENGKLKSVKGSVFPMENAVITGPGTHGDLLVDYMDYACREKKLNKKEADLLEDRLYDNYVPLHMRDELVLIRPNSSRMDLAFAADDILQQIVPKEKIKFLGVLDERVRKAIKKRGELWRINCLPKTAEEMKKMISDSKESISERAIYYHNMETGTRYLTFEEFSKLGKLDTTELAKYLNEIKEYSCKKNVCGHNEVKLFMADKSFNLNEYINEDFTKWDEFRLRFHYDALKSKFENAVKLEFRKDNFENDLWREAMLMSLVGKHDEEISEEVKLGLCPEFFMHIQWLPGARIENEEVIFDSIFKADMNDKEKIYDEKVRDIILNLKREYEDLEYINVGKIISSLSRREKMPGRREVYIAEVKVRGVRKEIVKIIRMQRWGAVELLHSGEEKDVYKAFWRAQEYKRYTLDRWNGCRQFGMNLLPMKTGEIYETFNNIELPLTYFERDYIKGIASDKISLSKYSNMKYCLNIARFLGKAAASNIILGRVNENGKALFDDGDEIIKENEYGLPEKILVGDYTGAFGDYLSTLKKFAEEYAQPVIRRAEIVPDISRFARVYIGSFMTEFRKIQQEYKNYRRAFNSLFKDRKYDPKGSLAYRYEKILERLENTDVMELRNEIMQCIRSQINI
jgi:hypothetical protein